MTGSDQGKLEQIETMLLDALNQLYLYRVREGGYGSAAAAGWVPLKEAARRIGKSERATWARAQRIPNCAWFDGGRRLVNLYRIQVLVLPPSIRSV